MITYIKIDGFKSFTDFEMQFTPFTVIAGANGTGKSNLFDALQLLADLSNSSGSSLNEVFGKQRGNGTELFTQYTEGVYADKMSFAVEMLVPLVVTDEWGESEQLRHTRLRYEITIGQGTDAEQPYRLQVLQERLAIITKKKDNWGKLIPKRFRKSWVPDLDKGKARHIPYIDTRTQGGNTVIRLAQDGYPGTGREIIAAKAQRTILSSADSVRFSHACAVRQEISSWRFLALNTEHLRRPTQKTAGHSDTMTSTGGNMAGTLHRLERADPTIPHAISRDMANLGSPLFKVTVRDEEANNQYLIEMGDGGGKSFSSRVLSEGTLRLLALIIMQYDDKHTGLLCFEEPENGIHPGRIARLIHTLNFLALDFAYPEEPLRQLIVNTHSPLLISELAKASDIPFASVWLTMKASRWVDHRGKRYSTKLTYISPVVDENAENPTLNRKLMVIHDKLQRITLQQAKEYLSDVVAPKALTTA